MCPFSFPGVIQHDAVRKQEQPLEHCSIFSARFPVVGRGKESFTEALENVSAETLHVQQPLTAGPSVPQAAQGSIPASPGPAQSSELSQGSSTCPQREGAAYFHFYSVIFHLFVLKIHLGCLFMEELIKAGASCRCLADDPSDEPASGWHSCRASPPHPAQHSEPHTSLVWNHPLFSRKNPPQQQNTDCQQYILKKKIS